LIISSFLGGAFGFVFAIVPLSAVAFAVVLVAFRVEFAEDARGLFQYVSAEDFVVCYLQRREVSFGNDMV
jgi:hypothetical protein